MGAIRVIKMISFEIVISIMIFLIWYNIIGQESFVKSYLLTFPSFGPKELTWAVNKIVEVMVLNHLLISVFIIGMSSCWFAIGRFARINTPREVSRYFKWWMLMLILGIVLSLGTHYYSIWTQDDLKIVARLWIGVGGLLFYIISFILGTMLFSPATVQSVVPCFSFWNR